MTTALNPPLGPDAVAAAHERIADHVRRTPMMSLEGSLFGLHAPVSAKLELLQHTGSFKPRGALNRMLSAEIPDVGVIASSGGNHGLAVGWAARNLGVTAEVFVPEVAPPIKVDRLRSYGATVHVVPGIYDNAAAACAERAEESGALMVPPFDNAVVVSGAGTMAKEMAEQAAEIGTPFDVVLISAGGGGLAAGATQWFGPDGPRVVVVEPETSCSVHEALKHGAPTRVTASGVAVDSLGAGTAGTVPFEILHAAGDAVESVLVTDPAIVDSQKRLWDQLRLVVEPGGAAAAAALSSGAWKPRPGERVAVVICGANCDPATVI